MENYQNTDHTITDEEFIALVKAELARARAKFPGANATNAALIEEVGETSTALMYEPWNHVVAEAVQVAAMAQRLAVEGDATMRDFRNEHVHQLKDGYMRRYSQTEHVMPEVKR